jgi:hypothetical protein
MKQASNGSLAMLALALSAVLGSTALVLMPAIGASDGRNAECGRLLAQVSRHDDILLQRDRLRAEVAHARGASDRVLRTIPRAAEQAHLMRMLALGTGPDMGTQTIVAGDSVPATPDGKAGFRAVPVTVEMQASFARVMEVLARAEGDRRLVRPIRIEIERPGAEGAQARRVASRGAQPVQVDGAMLIEARLEFDAVFGGSSASADGAAGGDER